MTAKTFGKWLAEKRKESGLTQPELARLAKTSKQYISGLERSAPHPITGALPQPTVKKVDAIAKALGAPLNEARLAAGYAPLNGAMPSSSMVEEIGVMFYGIEDLPPEKQQETLAAVRMIADSMQRTRRGKRK